MRRPGSESLPLGGFETAETAYLGEPGCLAISFSMLIPSGGPLSSCLAIASNTLRLQVIGSSAIASSAALTVADEDVSIISSTGLLCVSSVKRKDNLRASAYFLHA